jgi:ubiquinone/menaquinone biosynthesis C-methylase UbiE
MRAILLQMFGRPRGVLGSLGGAIMAPMNKDCGLWVAALLEIGPNDRVLEVGFGPGVVIQFLSTLTPGRYIAGIDPSPAMLGQARARNANGIKSGRVDLRLGSVERLPFDDDAFDKALAINSMQVWPDPVAGLREIRRVMKPDGRIALGFTPYSGQSQTGLTETLTEAGFTAIKLVTEDKGFCALVTKP